MSSSKHGRDGASAFAASNDFPQVSLWPQLNLTARPHTSLFPLWPKSINEISRCDPASNSRTLPVLIDREIVQIFHPDPYSILHVAERLRKAMLAGDCKER